jgi:hypothetical protein
MAIRGVHPVSLPTRGRRGWSWHIMLAMLALTFLAGQRAETAPTDHGKPNKIRSVHPVALLSLSVPEIRTLITRACSCRAPSAGLMLTPSMRRRPY